MTLATTIAAWAELTGMGAFLMVGAGAYADEDSGPAVIAFVIGADLLTLGGGAAFVARVLS